MTSQPKRLLHRRLRPALRTQQRRTWAEEQPLRARFSGDFNVWGLFYKSRYVAIYLHTHWCLRSGWSLTENTTNSHYCLNMSSSRHLKMSNNAVDINLLLLRQRVWHHKSRLGARLCRSSSGVLNYPVEHSSLGVAVFHVIKKRQYSTIHP